MEVQDISLISTHLGEQRRLTVVLPKSFAGDELPVVVCADGQCLQNMYPTLAREIGAGRCPECVLIGVHSTHNRVPEYIPGVDPERFDAHEQFFVGEVLTWADSALGITLDRKRRALFGLSNGAVFAITTGLKHNDQFGTVIAFSVPGGASRYQAIEWDTKPEIAFYLAAGNRELPIKRTTQSIARQLSKRKLKHIFEIRQAGHDLAFWDAELPRAIQWAFHG
jgi:enterochelin esterase-like enzyme